MDTKRIRKKESVLAYFKKIDSAFEKKAKTFLGFLNSKPSSSAEERHAIVVGLYAPLWVKNASTNNIRIALVRSCWEKLALSPKKHAPIRRIINELAELAFFAHRTQNQYLLDKFDEFSRKVIKQPSYYFSPENSLDFLKNSSWGLSKTASLLVARPGSWQKKMKCPESYWKNNSRISF